MGPLRLVSYVCVIRNKLFFYSFTELTGNVDYEYSNEYVWEMYVTRVMVCSTKEHGQNMKEDDPDWQGPGHIFAQDYHETKALFSAIHPKMRFNTNLDSVQRIEHVPLSSRQQLQSTWVGQTPL